MNLRNWAPAAVFPFLAAVVGGLWLAKVPAEAVVELQHLAGTLVNPGVGRIVAASDPFTPGMKAGFTRVVATSRSCDDVFREYRDALGRQGFGEEQVRSDAGPGESRTWLKGSFCANVSCRTNVPGYPSSTFTLFVDWQRMRLARCH